MLGKMNSGEKAKILDVTRINPLVRRRLLDLGITEGAEVCIKCKMPFGGPIMVESCGQCIGIRKSEALNIEVERL